MVGILHYLVSCTRPDIAFATYNVATQQSDFGEDAYNAAKRILKRDQGSRPYLWTSDHFPILTGYVDADFANYKDRKSLTGYIFKLAGQSIAWKTKKNNPLSLYLLLKPKMLPLQQLPAN